MTAEEVRELNRWVTLALVVGLALGVIIAEWVVVPA